MKYSTHMYYDLNKQNRFIEHSPCMFGNKNFDNSVIIQIHLVVMCHESERCKSNSSHFVSKKCLRPTKGRKTSFGFTTSYWKGTSYAEKTKNIRKVFVVNDTQGIKQTVRDAISSI